MAGFGYRKYGGRRRSSVRRTRKYGGRRRSSRRSYGRRRSYGSRRKSLKICRVPDADGQYYALAFKEYRWCKNMAKRILLLAHGGQRIQDKKAYYIDLGRGIYKLHHSSAMRLFKMQRGLEVTGTVAHLAGIPITGHVGGGASFNAAPQALNSLKRKGAGIISEVESVAKKRVGAAFHSVMAQMGVKTAGSLVSEAGALASGLMV